jgi:hypothetical protein
MAAETASDDAAPPAAIEITARGSRRSLEELYLELREFAREHGLEIDFRLSRTPPDGQ